MTSRLNIALTDRQRARLAAIARELGTTQAGVLRLALALLEIVAREAKSGGRLGVIRDNVVINEISVPGL